MPLFASHIHFSKKLILRNRLFKKNISAYRLAILGSILPDLDLINGLKLKTHGRCKEFYEYLKRADPKYAPLGWGMYIHELLDDYIEGGIIKRKNQDAIDLLRKYDMNTRDELVGHLLLEHSVESILLKKNPNIIKELHIIRQTFNTRKIADHFYDFFGCNKEAVKKALWLFKKISLRDFKTEKGIILLWINYSFLMSNEDLFENFDNKFKLIKNTIILKRNYSKYKKQQLEHIKNTELMFAEAQDHLGDIHKELDKAITHIESILKVSTRK